VERVHVVYSESSAWLINAAETAARSRGLQLAAYPAADLREAVHHYRSLLQNNANRSQAIWLPLDNITANEEIVLPMLLQAAWDKGLVLFSSKPSHAQRGALFSMFPDHLAMGRTLAEMASQPSRSMAAGIVPLAQLQLAVNLRTAAHLGLRFAPRQQETFDLVFPSQ
jgi:putative ABC transport system substrate-binding protein